MKKSLFTKHMTTYFITLVISYCLVAVFLSFWFYYYYYNQRTNQLINEGVNLNNIVVSYFQGNLNKNELNIDLSVVDKLLNARIWFVDNYGYVVASSEKGTNMLGKQLSVDMDLIRKDKIVVETGNFVEKFTTPALIVGIPMEIDGNVHGAVFMYSSLDDIKSALKKVYFVIWMSAFFAIVISSFIIYYFSERILIRPLGRINQTAKTIAKGDFSQRVKLDSNDEIGDLAVSFNYMADSLQNLEKMRRDFIANVSHELRSPITSINGFIAGMLDGTIPQEKWQYYLNIVHDEIQRLIRLINDLLDLARLESSEFSLNMGVFDINELIRERVIKFEGKINKKQIDMDVVLMECKVKVKGDRDRIDQVITNLLDNAIKFVNEKGKIQVKTEIKESRIIVSVFNEGTPIPKEEIKYIWDRFHKVDKARSKGGGTGLGLSIARQIINQHNQTMWAESGERGTTFLFTLSLF